MFWEMNLQIVNIYPLKVRLQYFANLSGVRISPNCSYVYTDNGVGTSFLYSDFIDIILSFSKAGPLATHRTTKGNEIYNGIPQFF